MDTLVSLLGGEAKTVAFAIFAGVFGFLAKSAYDLLACRLFSDQWALENSSVVG